MRLAVAALGGLAGAAAILVHPFGHADQAKAPLPLLRPHSPYSQQALVVDVYEYGFHPSRLVIHAGQTVAWRDVGKQFHVVTASTRAGRSVFAAAKKEGSASHLFRRPGRYPYHCSLHPQMRGVVVVQRRS
jgi:plastocyanin